MLIASNVRICISDDYELGAKFGVPFGGFYSCQHSNPLVDGHMNKVCPKGFSNHLATIEKDCEIQYCVRTGQLSGLKFPTFSDVPAESIREPAHFIISHNSENWVQLVDPKMMGKTPQESIWTTLNSAPKEMATLMKVFTENHLVKFNDESGMSKGAIAGLSVGLTTAVCMIVGIAIAVRRNRKQKRKYNRIG